jgi:hypothetical protein
MDRKLMQSNMKCDHYSLDFNSQQNSLSDFGMDSELLKAYNQNRLMIQKRTLVATPMKRKDSDIDFCMSNEKAKDDKELWQMIEDCKSEKDIVNNVLPSRKSLRRKYRETYNNNIEEQGGNIDVWGIGDIQSVISEKEMSLNLGEYLLEDSKRFNSSKKKSPMRDRERASQKDDANTNPGDILGLISKKREKLENDLANIRYLEKNSKNYWQIEKSDILGQSLADKSDFSGLGIAADWIPKLSLSKVKPTNLLQDETSIINEPEASGNLTTERAWLDDAFVQTRTLSMTETTERLGRQNEISALEKSERLPEVIQGFETAKNCKPSKNKKSTPMEKTDEAVVGAGDNDDRGISPENPAMSDFVVENPKLNQGMSFYDNAAIMQMVDGQEIDIATVTAEVAESSILKLGVSAIHLPIKVSKKVHREIISKADAPDEPCSQLNNKTSNVFTPKMSPDRNETFEKYDTSRLGTSGFKSGRGDNKETPEYKGSGLKINLYTLGNENSSPRPFKIGADPETDEEVPREIGVHQKV